MSLPGNYIILVVQLLFLTKSAVRVAKSTLPTNDLNAAAVGPLLGGPDSGL